MSFVRTLLAAIAMLVLGGTFVIAGLSGSGSGATIMGAICILTVMFLADAGLIHRKSRKRDKIYYGAVPVMYTGVTIALSAAVTGPLAGLQAHSFSVARDWVIGTLCVALVTLLVAIFWPLPTMHRVTRC